MEKLRITELDFEAIKTNLKNFLRSQPTFKDYDFEGSGLATLIDVLAYNTHYNAYYSNMIANEMFLDTAIIRDSVLSHAKSLNYVPASSRGAVANVTITVTPPVGNTQTYLTLDRYHAFEAKAIDGVNYTFCTTQSYGTYKENGVFTFSNVQLTQGSPQVYRQVYEETLNPRREFVIPDAAIDTTTLSVLVQAASDNLTTQSYTLSYDATEADSTSLVYFLDTATNDQYKLRFGDGIIGQALSNGNIVIMSYLTTDGGAANYANTFTTGSIGNFSPITIGSQAAAAGGAEGESIESIKYRAPLAYTAQNRMITPLDYETLLKNRYPSFKSLAVWGGEQNTPPVYGRVFLSYLLKEGIVLNETEKQRIIDDLVKPFSILTITPQFLDPDYVYLLFNVEIDYDDTATTLTAVQIANQARLALTEYTNSSLNKFGGVLVPSKIERTIDDTSPAIIGSHAQIRLQKRFTPILGQLKTYTIKFGFSLHRGGGVGAAGELSSTGFYIYDTTNIKRLAYLDETPNSFTGIDDIVIDNPGFNYYEAPEVIITGDGVGATAKATVVNGKVATIEILTRGEGYSRAIVLFSGGGGSGAVATAIITSRYGTVRSYYYNDLSQKVIINSNVGVIDHVIGTVTLKNFKPVELDTIDAQIRLTIEPEAGVLTAKQNQILTLDETDPGSLFITAMAS